MNRKLKWYHFLMMSMTIFGLWYALLDFPEVPVKISKLSSKAYDGPIRNIVIDKLIPNTTAILDSLLSTAEYVPLETSDESLIGQLDEIIISDKYIVLLDRFQTQTIFIFDLSGSFIRKIHNIGKGPGEFTQPTDIIIDEESDQILLLHGFPSKIIKYKLNGEFVGEIGLPMRFSAFCYLEDKSIVLVNEPSNRKYGNPEGHFNQIFTKLVILTTSGEFVYSGGPINTNYEENNLSKMQFGIVDNNEIVSFQPVFSDTIFQMIGYEAVPQVVLTFNEHTIDQGKVAGKTVDEFNRIGKNNDFFRIYGHHCQTDQFLALTVHAMSQELLYQVYYNKYNNEVLICRRMTSNNPLNPANPFPSTSYMEYFVSIVDPVEFMEVDYSLKTFKDQIPKGSLKFSPPQEQLDRIDENSNPILCFFTLRPEKINMESVYLAEE